MKLLSFEVLQPGLMPGAIQRDFCRKKHRHQNADPEKGPGGQESRPEAQGERPQTEKTLSLQRQCTRRVERTCNTSSASPCALSHGLGRASRSTSPSPQGWRPSLQCASPKWGGVPCMFNPPPPYGGGAFWGFLFVLHVRSTRPVKTQRSSGTLPRPEVVLHQSLHRSAFTLIP